MIYYMSSIWIPYIIFRNTDNDDAVDIENKRAVVSINRQGSFVRSGPEIAEEVVDNQTTYLNVQFFVNF